MPDDSLCTPLHTLTADRTPWLLKAHMQQPAGNTTHCSFTLFIEKPLKQLNSIQLHTKPKSKEYKMSD